MKNFLEDFLDLSSQKKELKGRSFLKYPVEEEKEKRRKKNKQSQRDLWGTMKYINICIMGVPEGEEIGRKNN